MVQHHGDRGPTVFALTATVITLSTIFVFLRLASRAGIVKRVSLDDYLIILAWLFATGLSFVVCYATKYGLGQNQSTISPGRLHVLSKLEYVFLVLYNPSLMATKTSILVFYLSLAKTQRVFKWGSIATMVVVNAAGLALLLVNLFQCRPLRDSFVMPKPADAHCTDIVTLYFSSAPVNILTDLIIVLLPMPVLKNMMLPRKQKWILYVTFGFGIFVAVVDVVRISYLQQAQKTRLSNASGQTGSGATKMAEESNFSWNAAFIFMWSAIEVNVGIMCACVPGLKPLVARFLPHILRDASDPSDEKRGSVATMNTAEMAAQQRIPSIAFGHQLPSFQEVLHEGSQHATMEHEEHTETHPESGEMGLMDFLTTPTMPVDAQGNRLRRTDTVLTNSSGHSRGTPTFFDFVNISHEKSIVKMTGREALRPLAQVTLLYFLFGIAYGFSGALNAFFQGYVNMTTAQQIAIHSAYFGGYFIGPLSFGRILFKRCGFKACYLVALLIYGTGTLIFWPSAVLTSFPAFLVSNFIVGLGLSTLEIAANSFIVLCGPERYGESRLNIAQGFQACGTVIALAICDKALFSSKARASSLIDVQWTYLAICIFSFILAYVYYCLDIPEATANELEEAALETHGENLATMRSSHVIWVSLALAFIAELCYVGAQEAVSTGLSTYIAMSQPGANRTNYTLIGHALFAFTRFLAAFAGLFVRPRHILAICFAGVIAFSAAAMTTHGLTADVMVMGIYFFEGPIFSLIYAMGLRGMGKYTKDASALLTASICGGGVFPIFMHLVSVSRGYQYSYCIVIACFAFGMVYPVYVMFVPIAKQQMEPVRVKESRSLSTATGGSAFSETMRKFSVLMFRKKATASDDEAPAEHLERFTWN